MTVLFRSWQIRRKVRIWGLALGSFAIGTYYFSIATVKRGADALTPDVIAALENEIEVEDARAQLQLHHASKA